MAAEIILLLFEPRHEKANVLHICENKDADQLRGNRGTRNVKPLAIFCSCTAWIVSDQVGNQNVGFLTTRLIFNSIDFGHQCCPFFRAERN